MRVIKRNEFYLKRLQPLLGAECTGLVSDRDGEFYGVQFRLAPKAGEPTSPAKYKTLWFQSDDEGNDIGSFCLEDAT